VSSPGSQQRGASLADVASCGVRSHVLYFAMVLAALIASCEDTLPGPAPAAQTAAAVASVAPWEPVDEAFAGCAGACGALGENAEARVQPGVAAGELTYCPVSGAVFTITAASPTVDVRGQAYHFCCDACAAYFTASPDRVLAARRLGSGETARR
jgi:YHS domain-containing protein